MTALLRLSAGLVWWAIAFALIYAAHGVSCSAGLDRVPLLGGTGHAVLLLALWAASLAIAAAIVFWQIRHRGEVLHTASVALSLTGLGAIAIGGLPILIVPACI